MIAWQRKRFRDHWAKLSKHGRLGRPSVLEEIKALIRKMSVANVGWGSPRIVGELRKLGIDFFVVPTVRNKVLFVLVVLEHHRRRVVHFNVTEHPTAQWTGQQIIEAFPWDTAPKYLLRDRDCIYGSQFQTRVQSMGIEEVLSAPRSPWQNAFVERAYGANIRTSRMILLLGNITDNLFG